jgi:hypothetical protein
MIVGRIDAASDQLHGVAWAEPNMKQAPIGRFVSKGADAQTGDRQAVLVGEQAADRLAEHLADSVDAIRPRNDRLVDDAGAPIEPDRVMRACIDDATHSLSPRRLEPIPSSDDVVWQDLVPCVLARDRAEVDDAIDVPHGGFHLGKIGEIGGHDLITGACRIERSNVGKTQNRVASAQAVAQARPIFPAAPVMRIRFMRPPLQKPMRPAAGPNEPPRYD